MEHDHMIEALTANGSNHPFDSPQRRIKTTRCYRRPWEYL